MQLLLTGNDAEVVQSTDSSSVYLYFLQGLASYIQQRTLRKISSQEANEKLSRGVALGVASLRFMPKSSSLRPIINLSKRTKVKVVIVFCV